MRNLISHFKRKRLVLLQKLFCFSVDHKFPRISAVLLALMARKINIQKGGKKIFCFGSLASLHDIEALVEKSGKHQYLYLPRFNFGYILRKYINDPGLNGSNYYIDDKFKEGQGKTFKYISKMFPVLKRVLGFDGLLTSNFGYIEQQEFLKVAREHNVPVIVLYKEGIGSKLGIDNQMKNYKTRKAHCDLFLCYNESIKESIVRHKVDGIVNEKIRVTGLPRLDYYFDKRDEEEKSTLTFFSYIPDDKFKRFAEYTEIENEINTITENIHFIVIQYAINNPNNTVVIKTKPSRRDISYVEDIVNRYLKGKSIPKNLTITSEGDAMNLVIESRCILGGNSTVLLESLLKNKKTATPDFNEFFNDTSWNLFRGYEKFVTYISTYDDLQDFIDKANERSENDRKELDDFLREFFYHTDGESSKRVEKYISELFN